MCAKKRRGRNEAIRSTGAVARYPKEPGAEAKAGVWTHTSVVVVRLFCWRVCRYGLVYEEADWGGGISRYLPREGQGARAPARLRCARSDGHTGFKVCLYAWMDRWMDAVPRR